MLPFNEETVLEPEAAKQDRLEIILGEWILEGSSPETANFFLASLSQLQLPESDNPQGLTWFRSRQINSGSFVRFRSREQNAQSQAGTSLIAGEIRTRRMANPNNLPHHAYRISAELLINPTRFARYQGMEIRSELFNDDEITIDEARLASRETSSNRPENDEVVLDNNDNVLLTRRSRAVASQQFWPQLVEHYWQNILAFLEQSFQEACDATMQTRRRSSWAINLKSVETYWEFSHDDALAELTAIKPSLRVFGTENRVQNYPAFIEGRERNSPFFKAQLINGVQSAIYAKTNKRVRFEIRHRLQGENGAASVLGGSHTSTSPTILLEWLTRCAEDASHRGNSMLAYHTSLMNGKEPHSGLYMRFWRQ